MVINDQAKAFDDKKFLLNPNQWPNNPICPVKNYKEKKPGGFPMLGVVVANENGAMPVVLLCNMYAFIEKARASRIKDIERKEYEDLDALLADGWMVD